jgi:hypothetical protein
MAGTQMRYKKLAEADERAFEDELETTYCQSLGIDPQQQQALLTGTATLESISNPGDKVQASTVAAIEPQQTASPNIEIARQTATKILNSLAGINTSIFLAAPTRCGKTHTLHKWLEDLLTRFPQAEVYVIAQKYEDFPGVPRDRFMIFDPLFPEESMRFLDVVYEKLQTRKSKPATEETYRNRPIKIILEDWFATYQSLVQKRNAQLWEDKASKLGSIATVGGQYNVGYFICTQTFNIASSGVADSNIRLNLALIAQGLVRTSTDDEEQGSYGVIEQMLNNSNVIASKETRDRLAAYLKLLIPASMTEQTPVILSTIGNPVLGLMPKIEVNKATAGDVPSVQADNTGNFPSFQQSGSQEGTEEAGNPYGKGFSDSGNLGSFLGEVLAETLSPVFSDDFPLKEHEQRLQLAKLIIAQNLGKERTIFLLWGLKPGGRNHHLYSDAREMLEKLIKGDNNDNN